MSTPVLTVYISIGNSDDKLTQRQWAEYAQAMHVTAIWGAKKIHGSWFSLPDDRYQNAVWCIEPWPHLIDQMMDKLRSLARRFNQESIAWAEVTETRFLT